MAAIFQHVRTLLGQDKSREGFIIVGESGSSLYNGDRYRRRHPLIQAHVGFVLFMSTPTETDHGVKPEVV